MQYNQALQELTKTRDEAMVLFVCVLFIYIEALRDNKEGAMTHIRHGIDVFNNSQGGGSNWARDYFRPLFIRLMIYPLLFGPTIDGFPAPIGLDTEDISGPHTSWGVCRYRLDILTTRCISFVREYETPAPSYPSRGRTHHPPKTAQDLANYKVRRDWLVSLLDEWLANYDKLFAEKPPPADNPTLHLLLPMICIVARIWVLTCAAQDEMVYDDHLEACQEIVDLARRAAAMERQKMRANRAPLYKSKFTVDMSFVPTLYFVVVKSRNLELR